MTLSPGGKKTVQLVVQVTPMTAVGDYVSTVTGDDGTTTHSDNVTMEVRPVPRGGRRPLAAKADVGIPGEYFLNQNYPNPFNPETHSDFGLPEFSQVRVTVYNMLGQEVGVLVDDGLDAGYYTLSWEATGLPSGVSFYRIEANDFTATRQMVLMK